MLLLAFIVTTSASAQLRPGDVFREYVWRPTGSFQRIVGFDATHPDARRLLPNPVLRVTIADLAGATRVVAVVEKLTSHAGTRMPRMRVNGKGWLAIPEPSSSVIPGTRGSGPPTEEYMTMRYPWVAIPLGDVQQGVNTFELECRSGTSLGRTWPQFIVYGVTFRVYYGAAKPRPSGSIVSPRSGSLLGDSPSFEVRASSSAGVQRVDVIGDYDDYDWRGDGIDGGWQYHYRYGAIRKHIGSAGASPYRLRWDTTWVPTQTKPFRVVARIVDGNGMHYVTPAVTGLSLRRSKTVLRHRSFNIAKHWRTQSLDPRHSCETDVTANLAKGEAAKLFLTTWNGWGAEEIGINGKKLVRDTGVSGDLSYDTIDVPLQEIRPGRNSFYTFSTLNNHGIEVQWPGIELFVRLEVPESRADFVEFGSGCAGSAGVPALDASALPELGKTFEVRLSRARATAIAVHMLGASNEQWGAIRLPVDLSPFGAPGCTTLVSLDVFDGLVTDGSGQAQLSVGIPNAPGLVGLTLFHQYVVLDASANSAGISMSNAGRTTVGT